MPSTRAIALACAALAALATAASLAALTARIHRFNQNDTRQLYAFKAFEDDHFTFLGHEVRIQETTDPAGNTRVRCSYNDHSVDLIPTFEPLGTGSVLARHTRWLRLLGFIPRRGLSIDQAQQAVADGSIPFRLVLVARHQRPGTDPETRGEVERAGWSFDFYEFLPDGSIQHSHLRYPESQRALQRRQRQAARQGLPIPQRRPDELQPGSWQMAAAAHVMPASGTTPGLGSPAPRWVDDATTALGWTLPAATASFIALIASLAVAFAPRRTAADARPPTITHA